MKRKMISLLAVLLVLTIFVLPVSAASPRLADEAGLLSGTECTAIEKQLDELSTQYGLDVVIVTTDSTGSSTPMEYADDYFDYNDYTPDGVLLLVSIEEGDWWISTTGYGITAFTDAGIEYIGKKLSLICLMVNMRRLLPLLRTYVSSSLPRQRQETPLIPTIFRKNPSSRFGM